MLFARSSTLIPFGSILVGSVVLSLTACGGDETPTADPAGSSSSATPGASSGDADAAASSGSSSGSSSGTPGADGAPPTPGSPAPPTCAPGKEKLTGDLDWTIKSGGKDRTAHVHVPASYDPTKGVPVVLDFHGYTSSGTQQAQYSGMNAKSDGAGFVAVHAEGTGALRSWNAGACCGTASSEKVDDVAFVKAIIDELAVKLCLDPKRVFSTGLSNGGFLSHRLACELSDKIAAIAPVAGVMGVPTCMPTRAVPVMHFHGTSDPLVPYTGNNTGYPSVADTIAAWAQRNKCTDTAHQTFQKDDVTCKTQSTCDAGSEVTLCTVDGGGHTWPGSSIPVVGLGKTTASINATDAMWDFFVKHPMP